MKEEYETINPSKLLPTLQLPDGTRLFQSIAILEYLEEAYPQSRRLLPSDPLQRAQVRGLVNMIACDIHPVQNLRVLKKVGDQGKVEWARHFITLGFEAVEKVLRQTAGKYCFGGEFKIQRGCDFVNGFTVLDVHRSNYYGRLGSCSSSLQCQ